MSVDRTELGFWLVVPPAPVKVKKPRKGKRKAGFTPSLVACVPVAEPEWVI